MLKGLDKILELIKENPDNSNLSSRYIQLATEGVSKEGVEAVSKLVDVYVEIYPKKALEVATALLDYARNEDLDKSCEKQAMEKISKCFFAMGKVEEAKKIVEEISKLFPDEAENLAPTEYSFADHSVSEDVSQTYILDDISEQKPAHQSVIENHTESDELKTEVMPEIPKVDSLDLGLKIATQFEDNIYSVKNSVSKLSISPENTEEKTIFEPDANGEKSDLETSKLNANVKIHLPMSQTELDEGLTNSNSMAAMSERGLGPNLLTESSETDIDTRFEQQNILNLEEKFWSNLYESISSKDFDSEDEYKTWLKGLYTEKNCRFLDGEIEEVSHFIWNAYKAQDLNLASSFFVALEPLKVKRFLVSQNLDMQIENLFSHFIDSLFSQKLYRRIDLYLRLYLKFNDSLSWAKFIYGKYRKYWLETSEVGCIWDEKDGVEILYKHLSRRSYPAISKISV